MFTRFTGMTLAVGFSLACVAMPARAEFKLAPLPYANDALEPHIDKMTMEIHHDRHHAAYVNNLNAQIKNHPELAQMQVDEVIAKVSKFNAAVRNNAGGHFNHAMFWQFMAPAGKNGKPSELLEKRIKETFGSLEEMKKQFDQAAISRFGSGWAWLIVTPDKKLAITSTANQDNPLMDLPDTQKGTPILCLDVWEHAYYLKYQNKRAEYVTQWWNVVNWQEVNKRFETATGSAFMSVR